MFDIDKYYKVKFTEGPWKYKREDLEGDGNYPYADFRAYIVAPPYSAQGRIAKMLGHTHYDAQLMADAPLLLAEVKRLHEVINKAMQQHTVFDMRQQLFESCCIDAEGQYESGHWEREE